MAKSRSSSNREIDSHRGGVPVFNDTPGRDFDSWITEFRLNFGKQLSRELRRHGIRSMFGTTTVVFSVDRRHQLRGRIVKTSAPPELTDVYLDTTRGLDGGALLDFPRGSNLEGFNFSMTYAYAEPPRGYENVQASLRTANGRILTQNGMQATAGVMNYTFSNRDARGNLISKNAAGKLVPAGSQAVSGKLDGGNISISTDVAGMLLPKSKPVELKAQPPLKLETK
jgi:hypothetical protein